MKDLTFSLTPFIQYTWYGKFVAPSPEWMHMSRPLHEYQLFLMLEGILYIADSNKEYVVHENEYLIMEPTSKQYGYHPSQCSFYWFHFTCEKDFINIQKEISLPKQGQLKNIKRFDILMAQFNDIVITHHDDFTVNLFATGILLELFHQTQIPDNVLSSSYDRLHRNIKNYIKWNASSKIKVNDLANIFGYHPKYFSSVFRKKEGISLKQYLILQTMERAKSELVNTKRSVLSISLSLGYSDSQAFSNAFKHIVGVSPTNYRNSFQNINENDK